MAAKLGQTGQRETSKLGLKKTQFTQKRIIDNREKDIASKNYLRKNFQTF